jgi:tRNA nucleotidyltransferase/poly(A) polymerase
MFFDPAREEILDYVGGKRDIESRVIRAIGNPSQRFQEDKLRLLRGVRFAARLGFVIEEATYHAITSEVATISVVSVERILAELRQMIEHVARVRGLELLRSTGLFSHLFPELADDFDDVKFRRSLVVLGWPNEKVSLAWGMAALMTPIERVRAVDRAKTILNRQRASNDDIERASWLVQHRDIWRDWESRKPHEIKRILARPGVEELFELAHASEHESNQSTDHSSRLAARFREWGEAGIDPAPLVTGDDLIAWGYVPGREFKEILDRVRDRQLDGELTTSRDAEAFVRAHWKTS